MPKKVLYGSDGVARVRAERAAADAPAAGVWTPDNLNADEIAAPLVADDVTLRGHDWQTVRLVARFGGTPDGSESVEVETLIAVPDPTDPIGARSWVTLPKVTLAPALATMEVLIRGHNAAFRITDLTLGTATSVSIDVTGGQHKAE